MGVHMPPLGDTRTGHRNPRVTPAHARKARFGIGESGGRGATQSCTATCGPGEVHIGRADSDGVDALSRRHHSVPRWY